jgi:hypothetical protein
MPERHVGLVTKCACVVKIDLDFVIPWFFVGIGVTRDDFTLRGVQIVIIDWKQSTNDEVNVE